MTKTNQWQNNLGPQQSSTSDGCDKSLKEETLLSERVKPVAGLFSVMLLILTVPK